MGRHTWNLSNDWQSCTRCSLKLDHGVCNCCGTGFKHVCGICIKTRKGKKTKSWGLALGNNKGCDDHIQEDDVMFPPEYPPCEHVIAEEKAREVGW